MYEREVCGHYGNQNKTEAFKETKKKKKKDSRGQDTHGEKKEL